MNYLLAVLYATIDEEKITYPTLPFEELLTRATVFFLRLFGSSSKELLHGIYNFLQHIGTFISLLLLAAIIALNIAAKRFAKADAEKYKKPNDGAEDHGGGGIFAALASIVTFKNTKNNKGKKEGDVGQDTRGVSEKAWGGIVSYVADDPTNTNTNRNTNTNTHTNDASKEGGVRSGLAADAHVSASAQDSVWGSKDNQSNAADSAAASTISTSSSVPGASPDPFATRDNDTLGGMGAIGGYATEDNQRKWQRVINHCESVNPTDWRLAILEADILLGEMLIAMGAYGQTLGERLKNVGRGALPALDKAWDAHKVRNAIAHEGADVVITHHEARRVIKLYEEVLKSGLFIR